MDFITHLPVSKELDCIFVVVDCVTKTAHFIPLKHPYTAQTVAQLFFDNVFKSYGMPVCIVCDRDPTFASGYWKEMFELQIVSFNFGSSYHPQTGVQTEIIDSVIEQYLRCFTNSRQKTWPQWLSWVEFCYNTSCQAAIKTSPFTILTTVCDRNGMPILSEVDTFINLQK